MTEMRRRICWLLPALTLFMMPPGPAARGQDIEVLDDDGAVDMAIAAPMVMWRDENFDMWVFGNQGNGASGRSRFDSLLVLQVEDVDRSCGLAREQKQKLMLAGRGDIKRFYDRVEEKRKKFKLVQNDQNKIGQVLQDIQPLQQSLNAGLFNEGSLFAKTLKKTLNEEQAASYQEVLRERRRFYFQARVELVVTLMENTIGMRDDQRRKFVQLLLEDPKPPKRFGQYDQWYVMVLAFRLPEAQLKPIFDEGQWRLLQRRFQQAKGLEQFLKTNDVLPDDWTTSGH